MTRSIEILKKPREMVLSLLEGFTVEQLNKIPEGFNNNIIWNLGHIIAAQQGICYKRGGAPVVVAEEFIEDYKSGTRPEKFVDEAGCAEIKELLFSTLEQLDTDYYNAIFGAYMPMTTRYGIELASIDDAIAFLPFHEGLHIGYIMSLRKLV